MIASTIRPAQLSGGHPDVRRRSPGMRRPPARRFRLSAWAVSMANVAPPAANP